MILAALTCYKIQHREQSHPHAETQELLGPQEYEPPYPRGSPDGCLPAQFSGPHTQPLGTFTHGIAHMI